MRYMTRHEVTLAGPQDFKLNGEPVAFAPLPQSKGVVFWAEYDTDRPKFTRTFVCVGTGHEIPEGAVYVGTAPASAEHGIVWHLFELFPDLAARLQEEE